MLLLPRPYMRKVLIALVLIIATLPTGLVSAETGTWSVSSNNFKGVMISEILVSPSDAAHNGTDWNGDGQINKESDQYIMITNNGSNDINLSNWTIDDLANGGSAACTIDNLTILSGESITFYRADTQIELDYFDGDTVSLTDSDGTLQSEFNYPGYDSEWDKVYATGEGGVLVKQDPDPASTQGTCTIGNNDNSGGGNSGGNNSVSVGEWSISENNYLGVKITEILASSSSEDFGGVDLDGDGEVWSNSEQYIKLTNEGPIDVDISDWTLDDNPTGGSAPCSIGWNTTISAGESITFFRSKTQIEFDYFEGDFAVLKDTTGETQSMVKYPAEDSFYDVAYTMNEDGTLGKSDPSPAERHGTCFIQGDSSESKYILKGRVVTMTGVNDVLENGNIMIEDGKIIAVWSDGEIPPISTDDVTVHNTGATIYPGLIDLHNHMHYNHIPVWDFDVHISQKSEEGGYTNRYQWGNNWDYGPSITWMKNNVQDRDRWDMASEQMKYAEVQAVAGGVTAVQGSPSTGTDAWDSMLSRNVELYNFGQDGISTCAVCDAAKDKGTCQNQDGTTVEDSSGNEMYANDKDACVAAGYDFEYDYTGGHLISQSEKGTLNAWFIHLAEGVDEFSKSEFDILWDKGLVMDETVIIHGTALDRSQFDKMSQVDAGLVWSPFSNLVLYGNTTDVVAADNAGVTISLAPDWGPSGTKNNLHELKVADMWNEEILGSHFSDYELVEMVTCNAAEISNWGSFVGQIKTGMYADLVVIDTFHEDPYRNMIEAIDPDVRLTVVQGKAVFGDIDMMSAMKGDDWEYINGSGFSKAIDVTSTSEVDGMQTWESIESGLAMAMLNNFDDIKEHWNDVDGMTDSQIEDWLATTFDGDYRDNVNHLKSMTVDPIYTLGDDRFFDVVNRSAHANYHIDMTKLYDYYDIQYDSNGERAFNGNSSNGGSGNTGTLPALGCTDSEATNYNPNADLDDGSCRFEITNNPNQNNDSSEDDCVGICDEDTGDEAKSNDSDPVFTLTLVMGIIFLIAIAVIFVSREKNVLGKGGEEDSFIPELPPLKPPKN